MSITARWAALGIVSLIGLLVLSLIKGPALWNQWGTYLILSQAMGCIHWAIWHRYRS
jgi:hypothetical protein